MRVIKFRGWHTGMNKMFSAEEMGQDQLTIMPDGKGFINVSGRDTRLSQLVPHMIPMQYTGLKDKNGNEIYEGDIIENLNHFGAITGGDNEPTRRAIVWDAEDAKFSMAFLSTQDYAKDFKPSGYYLCKGNSDEYEVIDNIHENRRSS